MTELQLKKKKDLERKIASAKRQVKKTEKVYKKAEYNCGKAEDAAIVAYGSLNDEKDILWDLQEDLRKLMTCPTCGGRGSSPRPARNARGPLPRPARNARPREASNTRARGASPGGETSTGRSRHVQNKRPVAVWTDQASGSPLWYLDFCEEVN